MAANRVTTKDLDTRLGAVEARLGEMADMLKRLEEQARQAQAEAQSAANRCAAAEAAANRIAEAQAATHQAASNGDGNGYAGSDDKLSQLESAVGRIGDRVERITQTLIQQAHRFS
jgi:membrane protein involved in colicin uptake